MSLKKKTTLIVDINFRFLAYSIYICLDFNNFNNKDKLIQKLI